MSTRPGAATDPHPAPAPTPRRRLLQAAGWTGLAGLTGLGGTLLAGCGAPAGAGTGPAAGEGENPVMTISYGPDPSQFGELTLPPSGSGTPGAALPVVVIVHGGFWRTAYDLDLGRPLAEDLVAAGFATWNIEYRRVGAGTGGGGGWPATGLDVAAAVDALAGPVQQAAGGRLDLDRVVGLGHSAGGQLVGWLAARPGLPAGAAGSAPTVRLRGAVAQAGVMDLISADDEHVGGAAVADFLGGSAADRPEVYAVASPAARAPIETPVVCVHGRSDTTVPASQSATFVAADQAAGGRASLQLVDGDHFAMITTSSSAWARCRDAVRRLLG